MDDYENEPSSASNTNTEKKAYKDSSPEEVKDRMKETVAKGVAAVAGALKGFTEEAKKNDLPNATKEVIQKAGETTRSVAGTAKSEFQQTKEELKPGASSGSSSSQGEAWTGSTMGDSSTGSSSTNSSTGTSAPSYAGSSSGGTSSYNKGSSGSTGMGGSDLGTGKSSGSDLGDLPNISKTDLAKSDKDLEE